ncbi:MAG: DUF1080 domain-containing protein [Maribacter sp.]|uniref:3-keto-disaccharide hydrolase n=1 Tax=Maribacter sp. TaxID=1897614 RepID=UPI003298A969
MKNNWFLVLIISIVLFSISCAEKNASIEVLFQEDANDWFSDGDAEWSFVNDELMGTAQGAGGFVMTKKSYTDFILELEFKPDSTVNSGIFIRCKQKEISFSDCYELNIWDLHPKQENRTGAIVSRASPMEKVETLDKWNTYKIRNHNDHLQVWINNIMMVDIEDNDLKEGPIALQAAESGKVVFRNVRLTVLN